MYKDYQITSFDVRQTKYDFDLEAFVFPKRVQEICIVCQNPLFSNATRRVGKEYLVPVEGHHYIVHSFRQCREMFEFNPLAYLDNDKPYK